MKKMFKELVEVFVFLAACILALWSISLVVAIICAPNDKVMRKMECKKFYMYEVLLPVAPVACFFKSPLYKVEEK